MDQRVNTLPPEVVWALPGRHGTAAEALSRVGVLCEAHADLFCAVLAVLATHQTVPRALLGAALRQCRQELAALSQGDVEGLLIAAWNGGQAGFDAVLRTRQRGERKVAALPWVKD